MEVESPMPGPILKPHFLFMHSPIQINPAFEKLIPSLSTEEFEQLEKNILAEGIRDSLVTWKGFLLDGHNRYKIAQRHSIHFKTNEIVFENEDKAKEWIIFNQFGRRNLSNYQRSVLALELEELFREKAKEKQKEAGGALRQKSAKAVVETRNELAKIASVSHDTIAKVKKIEAKATPEVKDKVQKGHISINEAYKEVKKEERKKENESKTPAAIPKGIFNIIYCDPPWQYDFAETDNRKVENQYPTMTVDELKEMQLPEISEDALLVMWATAPKLLEALAVIKAWGFQYKTHAIWDKEKIGMGYWFRGQHELIIVATKGNFSPPLPQFRNCSIHREERTEHSVKPEFFYTWIEKAFKGNKIELFARTKRSGWEAWGNESI